MTIKKIIKHGNPRWIVNYRLAGKQIRKFFPSESVARTFARGQEADRRALGEVWVDLSASERGELMAAYERAKRGGYRLSTALDAYESGATVKPPSVPLLQAIKECVAAKRAKGLRPRSVYQLELSLSALARHCGDIRIDQITPATIDAYLASRPLSARTRKGILIDISTLLSWCVKRGYIATNAAGKIERPIIEDKPPEIFTVDETRRVLEVVRAQDPGLLPFFALGLFAGLRSSEIARTSWAQISLERGIIEVGAATSKTRERRLVTIQPNLKAWLALGGELDCVGGDLNRNAVSNQARRLARIVSSLGYNRERPWPRNAARHSFVSYHLAMWSDAGKTALEAGHSVEILFRHYRELVTRQDAERYWAILPQ